MCSFPECENSGVYTRSRCALHRYRCKITDCENWAHHSSYPFCSEHRNIVHLPAPTNPSLPDAIPKPKRKSAFRAVRTKTAAEQRREAKKKLIQSLQDEVRDLKQTVKQLKLQLTHANLADTENDSEAFESDTEDDNTQQ